MEIRTSELFATAYVDIFRKILNHEKERFTFTGGRASCKSSFISICIVLLIVMNPSFNALILRKTANTLRRSVFEQIKWAIEKLQIKGFKIPQSETSSLPIVYTRKNGQKQMIIFAGADDPEKIKSIKMSNGYFAIVWFEEKTEFKASDIQNIKVSTLRGGSKFWIFESYNPPSSERNWCNIEARNTDENRIICHTTYLDIPKEWLGDAILHEIEQTKKTNFRAYENIFLGKATGTGRNIFENIELREITDNEINSFEWFYYGVDFGYFPDPFVWVAMSYDMKTETLYIFDELKLYKHGNFDASEKLLEHGANMSDRITADSAEPKSIADFREYGWNMKGAIKGKGSLESGFKWLQSRKKIVIDPKRAKTSADEFSLYEHEIDKRTGEILSGYPQGQEDHCLSAVRYALESVWTRRGN